MKRLIALICMLCSGAFAQVAWHSGPTDYHINLGSVRQAMGQIFVNSYTGVGPVAGTWRLVDLKTIGVPASALAAHFDGMLIITGAGYASETADLGVIFRKPGDTSVSCSTTHYAAQAVFVTNMVGAQTILGGQRSTSSVTVPLVNGEFEWCWTRSTSGNWPVNSSYGVNYGIRGYYMARLP